MTANESTGEAKPAKDNKEVMLRRICTKMPDGYLWRLSERTSTYRVIEFGIEPSRGEAMEKCTAARDKAKEAKKEVKK